MSSDPTTWGPKALEFVCPNMSEIRESIENDQHQYVSADLDVDDDSPNGQNNVIFADRLASAWDALRALNAAQGRSGAEGDMLTRLGELTGTAQGAPTTTKVLAQCTLTEGTTLAAGDALASVLGKPTVLFTPVVDFTAPSDGTHDVLFESTETGPVVCPAGATGLTTIVTPITGWTGISNTSAGVLGSNGETEAQFRASQELDLTRTGNSTTLALQADVDEVAGVISCQVLENKNDWIDGNGLPPHSVEVIIYQDGTVVDADLAEAIFLGLPAGTDTYGDLSASFVDANGQTQTIKYDEVAQRPVYLTYSLTTSAGYVGDATVKAAVVAAMTAKCTPGVDVNALYAHYLPMQQGGVEDVPTFYLGFSGSPSGTSNLSISPREIATFDVARVVIS